MRVRPWEATLAGTATLAVFTMAWVGAFHLAADDPGPGDIFGTAAVLADEAPPLPEPPAFVLGATVERTGEAAPATTASSSTTPGVALTTTPPAKTTPTTAPPPEPPSEAAPAPTEVVDAAIDVVGAVVKGVLSLL